MAINDNPRAPNSCGADKEPLMIAGMIALGILSEGFAGIVVATAIETDMAYLAIAIVAAIIGLCFFALAGDCIKTTYCRNDDPQLSVSNPVGMVSCV